MNDLVIHHEQRTGDTCRHCDCELVLVSTRGEPELYLECDCGMIACAGPAGVTPSFPPAA